MSEIESNGGDDHAPQNNEQLLGAEALKLKGMRLAIAAGNQELFNLIESGAITIVSKEEDASLIDNKFTLDQLRSRYNLGD